jgi:uncharacterized membrane protein (DUF373 family)
MARDSGAPTRTWIARAFTAVEDIVYLGLGVLLAASAAGLLVAAFIDAGRSVLTGTLHGDIIGVLDQLLLILLIVELLYTLQVSFREHALVPEPFLLVGLIAVIRRVLVVTAELGRVTASGGAEAVYPFIWELGVLAILVISLAVSLLLLRSRSGAPVAERA